MRKSLYRLIIVLVLPILVSGEDEVTFSRDIAPLLQERCVECHREGGGGPFPLQSYEDASRKARTIVRVVEDRYMPPWHAIGGDLALEGDRRLQPEEVALFSAWVEAGKPEGDLEDLPAPREFTEGWPLGEPDLVIEMDKAYQLPADGPDIYRNFVIPSGLKEEKFLRAVAFRPGTPEVVHHALLFVETSDKARKADAEDDEPGFAGPVVPQ